MINVKLTRTQILGLMRELPENHWMQIRLLESLKRYDDSIEHTQLTTDQTHDDTAETNHVEKDDAQSDDKANVTMFRNKCDFIEAWIGKCNKPAVQGKKQCSEHDMLVCYVCGKKAIKNCERTMGPSICGKALCEEHRYETSHRH